jgi:hypothetical protein
MTDIVSENPDLEPEGKENGQPSIVPKGRQSLSKVRRELSEEELSSPAVQRLLVEEIENLEKDNVDLKTYKEKYYLIDKKCAVLEEKIKAVTANVDIFAVLLALGAAAVGLLPSVWNQGFMKYIVIIFAIALFGIAIATRNKLK